jgi:non-specific serine/threonine protein kinase
VDRASLVAPGFTLDSANAGAVSDVVRHLDGMPLAIELAAARVRTLPPEDLATRLHDRLRLLDLSHRTSTARQQTLRATIDWSYDLLSPSEKDAFCQFAVFSGGWSLEASEKVCAPEDPSDDVYDLVDRLVGKSLLTSEASASSVRFRMLEVIREYALEKLDETHTRFAVEERHAAWYCEYAKQCAIGLSQRRSAPWLGRVEAERDNLLAATVWLLDNDDLADGLIIIETLTEFWLRRGRWNEARVWLTRGLGAVDAQPEKAEGGVAGRLMAALASVCIELGEDTSAQEWAAKAIQQFELCEMGPEAASAKCLLGRTYRASGEWDRADTLATEALQQFRESGDTHGTAIALRDLGILARWRGDNPRARALLEEGLALFREASRTSKGSGRTHLHAREHSEVLTELGVVAGHQGDFEGAEEFLAEGLDLASQRGNVVGMTESLVALASLIFQRGDFERAAMILGATQRLCERNDTVLPHAVEAERMMLSRSLGEALDPQMFAAALESGAALKNTDQVVDLASAQSPPPTGPTVSR